MRCLLSLAIVFALSSTVAKAQESHVEFGARGGIGVYSYIESFRHTRGTLGAEVCVGCAGRYALFGEFSFWTPPINNNTPYGSAYTIGGGLRIQGRDAVKPFLDLGMLKGNSPFGAGVNWTTGYQLGAGILIPVGKKFYVRPQVRLSVNAQKANAVTTANTYRANSVQVGVGWRLRN